MVETWDRERFLANGFDGYLPKPVRQATLLAAIDEGGPDAAVSRYREMREEYYGKGSYDFGSGTLTDVAQVLAQDRGDLNGAIAVMRLNVEVHTADSRAHMILGQLLSMKGDTQAARASLERSVELDPENEGARELLRLLTEAQ